MSEGRPTILVEDDRTGMDPTTLRRAVVDHLLYTRAKDLRSATLTDVYHALSHAVRDRLVHRWMTTQRQYASADVKRVYYLSAEYLLGRQLEANLHVLGLRDLAQRGLAAYDIDLDAVLDEEADPGLGNGGLGRLAACFMDSLATLKMPGMGYGIRYEFGIFRQEITDGWQQEAPDEWLRKGNPWEIKRPEYTVPVPFGGHVEHSVDDRGRLEVRWREANRILGVPFDTPVAGYGTPTVNTLRLWSSRASEQFDLGVFNDGDYRRAVERKALDESISKVLYPKDTSEEGRALRLKQQYFFVCCSVHDILRRYLRSHDTFDALPSKAAIQLNDTHPAIVIAELMRVLVDRESLEWEHAWEITRATCAYTNHTLLPEALERWPVSLFRALLPRHLEIIREIDRRFLRVTHVWSGGDDARTKRMAIVDDQTASVRMAHLSVVGSHTVNGVAELHSELLRKHVLADFAQLWPERFTNQTNGVTPRRWLLQCNPELAAEITSRIGDRWVTELGDLAKLTPHVDDPEFLSRLAQIKRTNKERLAEVLRARSGVRVDPGALFDVQVKRIHEYKRQLMCCLHVMWLYHQARFASASIGRRVVLVGGKAAPGYAEAKRHIKLINDVAAHIDADQTIGGQLKMHFLRNYNVSYAERVIPAADLSEQISLAGKEASGTGNMKFQMNGALTLGTLDGANIEIRQEVGPENFFLFGMDAEQVREVSARGYDPSAVIAGSERLQTVLQMLEDGLFNPVERDLHRRIASYLRQHDPFLVCADFDAYCDAQQHAAQTYADPAQWWPKVARNIAAAGKFSSDRTIRGYASEIWGVEPLEITLPTGA
ncbi:MAG: glycogen/starch/alpha-glucan phosphorylase [Myxococcales bacterium]|nr:glycogen/starch/alpha-glucan phosphorylase [Myxococcales bacterium]